MLYMFTLDAHELFGPFKTMPELHKWAVHTGRNSYQIIDERGLMKGDMKARTPKQPVAS